MNSTATKHKLVFATNNEHKLQEVRQILGNRFDVLSLAQIGCHDDIPETAKTLEGNALIKARWVKEHYGCDCFADDTGLEVEALGGEPGVRSARYASEQGHDSKANMDLLLKNMDGLTNRKARFRTVMALAIGRKEFTVEGIVEGEILTSPSGSNGFGYDPVFRPQECDLTFAQMDDTGKNSISHRRRATERLVELLSSLGID